jgi:hypothetical protein
MHFLLLGLDSLIACVAISPVVSSGVRWRLAALFGIADGAGFLIGAGLGWRISDAMAADVQTVVLLAVGLNLIFIAAGARRIAASAPLWVIPVALTLDNLTYGLGDGNGASVFQQAGAQALSSALLAMIGLLVAAVLPRMVPAMQRRTTAHRTAGAALIFAAGAMALLG